MTNYRSILAALACCFLFNLQLSAQLESIIINEIMPLNETFRLDGNLEYSDWIELWNTTGSVISLEGWTLSDDPEITDKWSFPAVNLPANDYIIVYTSGKDSILPGNELHTNFKLDAEGEFLALYNPQGVQVFAFNEFPAVKSDESYGYLDGAWSMFVDPSPGMQNSEEDAKLFPPRFSVDHGLYYEDFILTISATETNVIIYYTTDGTEPSTQNGKLYTGPLSIDSTTVLRAIVTKGLRYPSEVLTTTYIFPEQVIRQGNSPTNFPDQWGPWTQSAGRAYADYEMDQEVLLQIGENRALQAMEALPTLSLVSDPDHFWSMETNPETGGIYMYPAPDETDIGRGWERPVSVEYFSADGSESFQVNCGIQINGGESRRPEKNPKHSFRLRFRGEYGPSKLDYPLFEEPSVSEFNVLVLRGGFNNTWTHWGNDQRVRGQYVRDIWAKDTYRAMNHLAGNSVYAHLFINGVYWGIYAPSERMDKDFAASYLKGGPEDMDVIKDYVEVADGTIDAWNELRAAANAGFSSNEAFYAVQGLKADGTPDPNGKALLDLESIMDYMLINLYGGNTDWDHHNWAAARNRNNPKRGFEFLVWDTEHVFESLTHNMLSENNSGSPSDIFQSLRQNETFRKIFADRVQKHCFEGGLLSPEGVLQTWNRRSDQVEAAIPAESMRWGDYRRDVHVYSSGPYELYTYDNHWLTHQSWLKNTYFPQRTSNFIEQLRVGGLFPQLDAPSFYINAERLEDRIVNKGDELSMSNGAGDIYYTLNGDDPAAWANEAAASIDFITLDAGKKVLVPTQDIGTNWKTSIDYLDSGWLSSTGAPGGIGYERNSGYEDLITLDVESYMHDDGGNPNPSCYVRVLFNVEESELENLGSLVMNVYYDDGFEAYLNGTKVAAVNAPSSIAYNSVSTAQHEAETMEAFNLSSYIDLLKTGTNLLAVQAMNANTTSSDFVISFSLTGSEEIPVDITEGAILYTSALDLDSSLHVKARTYQDGNWSALNEKFLLIPEDYKHLKITEIQYNPQPIDSTDDDNFEFVELKNTGSGTLDLGGVNFGNGIDYTFEPETAMKPGEFIVLAAVKDYFTTLYGFEPFDDYKGRLDNGGEHLSLLDPFGDTICSIRYQDDLPWPQWADGTGLSMVPVELNPTGDQASGDQWRESLYRGGSPGADDVDTTTNIDSHLADYTAFAISEIYPNPFTESVYMNYTTDRVSEVYIRIYSISGAVVYQHRVSDQGAGTYTLEWNGSDSQGREVVAGIYIAKITIGDQFFSRTESVKLVKIR